MKERFKKISADILIRFSVMFSLSLSMIFILMIGILYPKLPPYIPFFNSMPWGLERLASSTVLIVLFFIFLFVILLNNFLGFVIYERYPLITRFFSISSFLFVFLGLLACLQIIFLVF